MENVGWYGYAPGCSRYEFRVVVDEKYVSSCREIDIEKLKKRFREAVEVREWGHIELICEMDGENRNLISRICNKSGVYGLKREESKGEKSQENPGKISYCSFNCDNEDKKTAVWKAFCIWAELVEEAHK